MAVKQKVVEGVNATDDAYLQRILRVLQEKGLQEKMCSMIVTYLGLIQVPTDPHNYKLFLMDIKCIQDKLMEQCTKEELIYVTLGTLYKEISKPDKQYSPAMSIVLQLLNPEFIPKAVDSILNISYSEESLKRALFTLCTWLTKWTWTDNLGPLILCFMKGLEAQNYVKIVYEVTLITIVPLFNLMVLKDRPKGLGEVVKHMLNVTQHSPEVFNKIIPLITRVITWLNKDDNESSRIYLRDIIVLSARLIENFPECTDQLKNELEPFFTNGTYTEALNDLTWDNGFTNFVNINMSINGKVGLNNLGNTCYMNSVLQALFMTKPFRNEILLYDNNILLPLLSKLQVLFALLQHSQKSALSPNDILNIARPPGFVPGHQHDSSEFLGYLLDVLHEQEKNILNGPSNSGIIHIGTVVQSAFGGRTISESRCSVCCTKSERIDNFRDLQLSFPNNSDNQSVQGLLNYYLQPEQLCGDNQYHCDVCKCLTDGERVICIEEAPPRLILTLKHFRYDPASQQRTKLLQSVKLDEIVKLDGALYELYAAVVHCGSSLDSGHYYTFAKDGNEWYKFNDCSVMKALSEELFDLKPPETAYILFYSRQDNMEMGDLPSSALSDRLQLEITKDRSEYDANKKRFVKKNYDVTMNRQNRKDDKYDDRPPPGCGDGGGFSLNSVNRYVC